MRSLSTVMVRTYSSLCPQRWRDPPLEILSYSKATIDPRWSLEDVVSCRLLPVSLPLMMVVYLYLAKIISRALKKLYQLVQISRGEAILNNRFVVYLSSP